MTRTALAGLAVVATFACFTAISLRRSLDLHTTVLLWLNDAGTHLRISEAQKEMQAGDAEQDTAQLT